jgi:hypothetical protein
MSKSVSQFGQSSPFDAIRQVDSNGREYWSARDLQGLLGYTKWQNFEEAIERAKAACKNAGHKPSEQITDASKLQNRGNRGATQEAQDYHLTRYACYMVAMNGDPRKPEIATAQTYFAIKTREAEIRATSEEQIFTKDVQRRCMLNEKLLPTGYWCVVTEMWREAWTLEAFQKELKPSSLPDGSCGTKWRNYLKSVNHPLLSKSKQESLHVPNLKNRVKVWIYPIELLYDFRNWLRVEYADYYLTSYSPSRLIGANQIEKPKKRRWLR